MKSFILCRMSVSEHGHFFEWRNTQCKFSSGVAGFLWYQLILKTDKIRKSEAQQHQVYWEKSFFESQCSPGWKSPAGTGPKVMYKPYFSDHLNPSISEQLNVRIISLSPTYQGTSHPPYKKKVTFAISDLHIWLRTSVDWSLVDQPQTSTGASVPKYHRKWDVWEPDQTSWRNLNQALWRNFNLASWRNLD